MGLVKRILLSFDHDGKCSKWNMKMIMNLVREEGRLCHWDKRYVSISPCNLPLELLNTGHKQATKMWKSLYPVNSMY